MDAPTDRYLALPDETVESLTRKLELERRVQYGAEKMLDVIEQKGASDGEDNEQVRERIIAQLEQANAQIKVLEAQLARLAGASPQKRKRPQPRLNGYASTSSLRLSSSYTSSHLSQTSSRPRAARADSSATSDRWHGSSVSGHGTPSRQRNGGDGNGNGDQSPGLWSSSSAHGQGGQGMTRETSGTGSGYAQAYPSASMWGQASEQLPARISEADGELLGTISAAIYRLRTLGGEFSRHMKGKGKGKGKENEQGAEKAAQLGEEPWRCMTQAADLLKRAPVLKDLVDVDQIIQGALPFLSDWSTPRHRAAAYRLLRSIANRARWRRMLDSGLEWLIIRTMARDTKAVVEREQALLLLRAIATLPRSRPSTDLNASQASLGRVNLLAYKVPLTDGLIRAIVAIAENSQDAMWIVSMETLVEIGILDIERLVQSDALRIVLLSFVNGPSELGPAVTGMLLYLANAPQDRRYLIAGSDVEMALTGLTEGYGQISARQANVYKEKLQNSVKCINLLLGSWSGLIYLCKDQYRAVKSLVSSLLVPVADMRDAVLDLVISSLHIKTPSFTQAFLDGKRLTVYNRTQEAASEALHEQIIPEHVEPSLTLVDQYIALILAVFLECNLLENLVTLIEENVAASRKATLLLGEILRMGNRLLPSRYAAQLQALPKLFNGATAFNDANERHFALSALTSINSLERNQAHTHRHFYGAASSRPKPSRLRASSLTASATGAEAEPPVKARGIRGVRDRMGISVEDKLFQQMIVDSGVLLGRDHTKWNFDLILDLIEGPLHTPKRMDEAIRATKFIRRLIGFLQPHNNRFSSIKRTRPNHKWVQLACGLIGTMLATPEGLKYLGEDKLLKQLSECFVELETKPFKSSAYLSAERVEGSLMYGYFELIGVLTGDEEGIKLLEQNRLFNSFYHLFDLGQRDDIVRLLIECFDYTIDSHTRILFTQALTASQPTTRLFATHHLGRALQDTDEWPIESSIQAWALQLLISQLYDPSDEVCEVAIMYLEEICADNRRLQMVVDHQPSISHLDDSGHTLFMRFLSTSTGFLYLREAGCVDQELDIWLSERNLLYVIEVETFVTSVLRPFTSDTADDTWDIDGMTPTHFFGELTKTQEGCMYLRERGLVAEFAEIVRLHGLESEDQAVLTNVKSMLWVLGHIGSTKGGLPFLENEEIIEVIVEIAEQSPILTMKGVCFFVLGLISTTVMGAEILEEMGWTTSRTALGTTNGICLPTDISRFAYIQPWVRESALPDRPALPKLTGLEAEIMLYITNLSNYVLATKASQHLKRRHPKYFASLTLFHRALRMISTNHYLPPVRGFILDLFDVPLTPETLGRLRRLETAVEAGQSQTEIQAPGAGEGGGLTGRMGTLNPSPLKMSADPAEVGTRTSRSRTDSRARLDRERNGDGASEAVGEDPTTPLRAQSDDKVSSRHSERNRDRYRDGESESAGSPIRNAQVESATGASGATARDTDPYEYRRRAASSPGPASSSPVRSYSDGDGLSGRSDYNRIRHGNGKGQTAGGGQGQGARLRGLTISTIPLGGDGMFS